MIESFHVTFNWPLNLVCGPEVEAAGSQLHHPRTQALHGFCNRALKPKADLLAAAVVAQEQDAALKEALREVEREEKRQAISGRQVDMEYLKNMCASSYPTEHLVPRNAKAQPY